MKTKEKILIYVVDDERFNRLIVKRKLENSLGCKVRTFSNVLGCLEAIDKESPDLILCDMYLHPRKNSYLNGDFLLEASHSINPKIPFVIYSLENEVELMIQSKGSAGFVARDEDFLDNLLNTVKNQLEQSKKQKYYQRMLKAYLGILIIMFGIFILGFNQNLVPFGIWQMMGIWIAFLAGFILFVLIYPAGKFKSKIKKSH